MELTTYFQQMWQLAINGEAQGIFFWFSIYMLTMGLYSLILQFRTRSWPFVQGDLIKLGYSTIKSDQSYLTGAQYTYSVSGVNYSGTRISSLAIMVSYNLRFILDKQMSYVQRSSDGSVKVFYNPKKPEKSFLIIPGKKSIGFTLAMSLLPLILFYLEYYA